MHDDYVNAGTLPSDIIEVDSEIYDEFSQFKIGKIRVPNEKGMPSWGSKPKPSQKALIAIATEKKSELLLRSSDEIAPLQDAIDLNIATDKELMLLNAWKQYRVDLNRIDTATAPDITWPEKPQ